MRKFAYLVFFLERALIYLSFELLVNFLSVLAVTLYKFEIYSLKSYTNSISMETVNCLENKTGIFRFPRSFYIKLSSHKKFHAILW